MSNKLKSDMVTSVTVLELNSIWKMDHLPDHKMEPAIHPIILKHGTIMPKVKLLPLIIALSTLSTAHSSLTESETVRSQQTL
mgnify:CR=1 FL=1